MKLSIRCQWKNHDWYRQKYHESCGGMFVVLTIIVVYLLGVQTSMNIISDMPKIICKWYDTIQCDAWITVIQTSISGVTHTNLDIAVKLIVPWWRHMAIYIYWSTLVQVMGCYLTASSHYLNQWGLIISKVINLRAFSYTKIKGGDQ